MKFGNIDLQKLGELQNAKLHNLPSTPSGVVESQFWYDTATHLPMYYNGTTAKQFGLEYTFSTGLTENTSTHTVTLNLASTVALGGVIVGSNINVANDGTISVNDASTSAKGVIEIATDSEASTGTSETLAINPKQLATKIGLTDLSSTATGLTYTNTTGVFSLTSGYVIPTTTDFNAKITLTDLSIDSGSTNYLSYNSSTGKFSAKVDTTVTDNSTNLVTSGAVSTAIALALTGALKYQGTWTATGQTDYSSITLPVAKGYMYAVSGSATVGGVEWNSGDYLVINKDIAAGGTITSSDVEKIDNTEASDIVRLNATQTLTNKTIDADDNTISDLTLSNFKSGVVRTSTDGIRGTSSATDTSIVTEKAIAAVLAARTYSAQNPALTVSGGICTWTVTHNMNNSNVGIHVYEVSTGDEVMYDRSITSANVVTVKILADANIAANTYKVVILG